jgi:predicted nucleic acid-binding protein
LFAEGINDAIALGKKFDKIFLDTNVLLSYYGMSKVEKTNLLTVLRKNKDRIYLPYQVQVEFMNNRLGAIKKDLFNPLKKIHSDFENTCKSVTNDYDSYLKSKQNILVNDYPEIWKELNDIKVKLEKLMNNNALLSKVKEAVNSTTETHKNIVVTDEMLDICSEFNLLEELATDEVEYIEKQFDELSVLYKEAKEAEKSKLVFPGSGDIAGKTNPYGDFIIYHELLKYMAENDTDALFLTNEVSKDDWMQRDKTPIIHYIEKSYLLTNHIMFIVHAEKPLQVSFENIHKDIKSSKILANFLDKHPSYTYYVSNDNDLEVKISALRNFLLLYKEDYEYSYSTSEGVFPRVIVTALTPDINSQPTLYIEPEKSFFGNTEEGRMLKEVFNDTLELWCKLDKVWDGSNYVVFWRRGLECKKMLMKEFVNKYQHDDLELEVIDADPYKYFTVKASSSLGSTSLVLGLNDAIPNEIQHLKSNFKELIAAF